MTGRGLSGGMLWTGAAIAPRRGGRVARRARGLYGGQGYDMEPLSQMYHQQYGGY